MKMNFPATLLAIAAALLLAGCATHQVNWDARIGTYTFDQAVVELGPPDKQAELSDGRKVAEWISRYSGGGAVMVGGSFYSSPGSVSLIQSGPSYYESKLRLTFTTNNVLAAWAKK
jgi:hypothetical protein